MNEGTLTLIIYCAAFFLIFYFFLIRPQSKQNKQRKAMLESLRANDKIITAGGIYGKIKKVKENSVIVQIADKVEIELAKSGVASVENREIVVYDKKAKNDKKAKDDSKAKENGKAKEAKADSEKVETENTPEEKAEE